MKHESTGKILSHYILGWWAIDYANFIICSITKKYVMTNPIIQKKITNILSIAINCYFMGKTEFQHFFTVSRNGRCKPKNLPPLNMIGGPEKLVNNVCSWKQYFFFVFYKVSMSHKNLKLWELYCILSHFKMLKQFRFIPNEFEKIRRTYVFFRKIR